MIYAVIALSVVCVGLLVFMRDQFRAHDRQLQMMADRVQAPERLPAREDAREFVAPERVADEWATVGTVTISDDYGLED